MAKRFLFLEVIDPEVVNLLTGIRGLATEQKPKSGVHVTIRGPYNREIPRPQIEQYQKWLRRHPLLLESVGSFHDLERHVVYIRVKHPVLRRIWWKPDFPVNKFGFNPHITLYDGNSAERANRLRAFLEREQLKLLTWEFRVTAYVADHADFFKPKPNSDDSFLGLVNRGLVRADILARLGRTLNFVGAEELPRATATV